MTLVLEAHSVSKRGLSLALPAGILVACALTEIFKTVGYRLSVVEAAFRRVILVEQ